MKLAHFSDIHVMCNSLEDGVTLKRFAAAIAHRLTARTSHFSGSDMRTACLLEDIDAQQVQHALCTGDVTCTSTRAEFARTADVFGTRVGEVQRFTCIPGNHDRYVPDARGRFEEYFAPLCAGGEFPFVKTLSDEVVLVALDTARPTSLFDSSGLAGSTQLQKLARILTDSSLRDTFVVLALHYGLVQMHGQRDGFNHRLRDDRALVTLLGCRDVTVDLVLHGHLHQPFIVQVNRRRVINPGSATDMHVRSCGYNVYDINPRAFTVRIERREWNGMEQCYQLRANNVQLSTR